MNGPRRGLILRPARLLAESLAQGPKVRVNAHNCFSSERTLERRSTNRSMCRAAAS